MFISTSLPIILLLLFLILASFYSIICCPFKTINQKLFLMFFISLPTFSSTYYLFLENFRASSINLTLLVYALCIILYKEIKNDTEKIKRLNQHLYTMVQSCPKVSACPLVQNKSWAAKTIDLLKKTYIKEI
jgi:hypothetical protein